MPRKTKLPTRFVEELVLEIAGSDAVELVRLMVNKDYISEFKIAEKLDITVNKVRNILYRLQTKNLVDFIRKKDKKKGWYIYYWLFDLGLAKRLIKEMKENKLVYLKKRLEHEKVEAYYRCPNDCIRLNSVNAMEYGFRCDECGEILVREDIKKSSEIIKQEIRKLEEDVEELRKEFIIKAREEKLKEAKEKIKKRKVKKKKRKVKKKKKVKKLKKKVKKRRPKKKPRKRVKKRRVKKKKKPKKKVRKVKKKKKSKKKKIVKRKPSKKFRRFLKKVKKIKKARR